MGVCHSANTKRNNRGMNSPTTSNNQVISSKDNSSFTNIYHPSNIKLNPKLEQLSQHLSQQITSSPFNNMSPSQQEQLEADYISSGCRSPYKFIESNQHYSEMFKLLYQVCYLKCEPILGNITEEKKESDLLFFRIVLFYLTYSQSFTMKYDTAQKMILNSFDQNQKKHKLDILKLTLLETVELCIEILIYMNLLLFYLSEVELKPVLQNDMYLLKDKYMKVSLDEFFFHQNAKFIKLNIDNIKEIWYQFITHPIYKEEEVKNDYRTSQLMLSDFRDVGLTTSHLKSFKDIGSNLMEEIIHRIIHMFSAKNMFDVLATGQISSYTSKTSKANDVR